METVEGKEHDKDTKDGSRWPWTSEAGEACTQTVLYVSSMLALAAALQGLGSFLASVTVDTA